MSNKSDQEMIEVLGALLEQANTRGGADGVTGSCNYTDANGNAVCNNFSEFQRQQVGGIWGGAGTSCPSEG
jgi:hypothetical protein